MTGFGRILEDLNRAGVQYVLVGGIALIRHGSPVPTDSLVPGRQIHLATPHGDLDLLAELASPLTYEELVARADAKRVDGVEAPICSLADLVALKRIAGREQDGIDLRQLEEAHGALPDSRDLPSE